VTYHLKDFFDAKVIARIAADVGRVAPGFPTRAFVRDASRGLERLELMDRGRHICAALRKHLPAEPAEALGILVRSLGPPLEATEGHGMAPFLYLPHVLFVAEHGLERFDAAMAAQHALTQRFSAEFSLRHVLAREPERTLAVLRRWTSDPSPHVRRLVSEGTRPRLPWAGRLRTFEAAPGPTLELLERLKDDPHPYVRRSVANHLNDIAKTHPALVVDVAERWLEGATPERRALVQHALRTLVKRGDARALAALGYRATDAVTVASVVCTPARPRIGGSVHIAVEVAHRGRRATELVVDLVVHFVKARGSTGAKTFKLRALRLGAGERAVLEKRVSLAQQTTRTHHPGRHAVEVLVNGRRFDGGAFTLVG
jgi:3-methyladenine DNA glycosylase AlkC